MKNPAPYVIQGDSIADVHDQIMVALIEKGCMNEMNTENNEYTWEFPSPIIAHVLHPNRPPFRSEGSDKGPMFIAKYRKDFLVVTPPRADGMGFSYTYPNRLFDYPRRDAVGHRHGDGHGGGIDQINHFVVRKLREASVTRRAVAVSWVPEFDSHEDEPPCIDLVQFLYRDDNLRLIAYIRSNDMLSAWGENANGLGELLGYVGGAVGVETGSVTTFSASAHCYSHRDAEELKKFHAHLYKNGLIGV